jgi:hypothetical protein
VSDGCQLDVSLLYEVVADDVMTMLLPINVMRNYALLQVGRVGAGRVGLPAACTAGWRAWQ